MPRDTIFALSSGRPPAAIAVVRISGPCAHAAGKALAVDLPPPRMSALRTLRCPATGEALDDALVLRFDGPNSATGEDLVELHCHGGRAVVDAVMGALATVNALRLAEPGEFTRRAFENGRIDLTEAEGLADLLEAETEAQRRSALALAEGGLRRQIERWQEELLGLSAQAERAIDYAGEDDSGMADDSLGKAAGALAEELSEWLDRPRVEPLKEGVRVVIAGPPNSGKSSLINALTGLDKAIVTDIPGTTRDVIEAPLAIDGMPFVLVDTAGLRSSDDAIESEGVARATRRIAGADLVLWLGDPTEAPTNLGDRLILIRSKAELDERPSAPGLPVSSVTGIGLKQLLQTIGARGRCLIPAPDQIALNRRQWLHVAEARTLLDCAKTTADAAIQAELLRSARFEFDYLTGRAGIEDMLDALFSRFCLGK